jgi:hypothetical protein
MMGHLLNGRALQALEPADVPFPYTEPSDA